MGRFIERRTCRRFEVPGAVVRYKSSWHPLRADGYSFPCRLLNLSKGGVAFECHERLSVGKRIIVRLIVPGTEPIKLRGWVRWYGYSTEEMTVTAGVEFRPFGVGLTGNPLKALDRLRDLDGKYGGEQLVIAQARNENNPVRDHLF